MLSTFRNKPISIRYNKLRKKNEHRWVFYGSEQQVNDIGVWYANSVDKPTKYPVLAINAIDGSVIDLSKGY